MTKLQCGPFVADIGLKTSKIDAFSLIKKANFNPMKYLEDLDRTGLPKDMAILAPASPIVPSVLA